jgi:histidinol phosphatase-like PHP family hydrolase
MNTIDEIVQFAAQIRMKKLVITDHSQAALDALHGSKKNPREVLQRWKNVHNDVQVVFGVEADLLNEQGDICAEIQGLWGDFTILSYHPKVYSGDKGRLTEAYVHALEKHHQIIDAIGHLYVNCRGLDVQNIVFLANAYKIPLELNCFYLASKRDVDEKALDIILEHADQLYVNSDAHTLYELKEARQVGFKLLAKRNIL